MARKRRISPWSPDSGKTVVSSGRRLKLRRGVLTGAGLALVLVLVLTRRTPAPAPQAPDAPAVEAAAAVAPTAVPAAAASLKSVLGDLNDPRAFAGTPVPIQVAMSPEEAQRFIDEQNAAAQRQHELLLADGWKPVDMPPPEPGLMGLDPSLLEGRERDVRTQLETNSLHEEQLDNALSIALQAKERRTRYAAIEALGHARSPKGQELLTRLFDQLEKPEERRMVLGYLRPRSLGEPSVQWMIEKMASSEVDPELKKQMSFSLVLAELVEQGPEHKSAGVPRVLRMVPESMQPMVRETFQTLTQQTPPHSH